MSAISEQDVIDTLKTIFDPEFRVDIYNLGLIYEINTSDEEPEVKMTLTTPTCPAAGPIIAETKHKLGKMAPFKVELTFDPPWEPKMITRDGLRMLPPQLVDHLDLDEDED